ncbi:hypothetical protein H0H81_000815 [Sphagnurus paluster]|uniref:GDP/GTP exchange factor Sec2 N-terminal domain-containing protein n=1 Tax=Sphagnurus paluster TaxID=117069 RepID=A0A9P7FZV8_9AGAR|nr:hypothetical protein H0H81_000815 [Sphagnurus paluster]
MAEAPHETDDGQQNHVTPEPNPKVEENMKSNLTNGTTNGTTSTNDDIKRPRTGSDPDAQDMLISSLRSQIQDLFSQVTELNTKLVKSYDRVSDLEDDIHVASAAARASSLKISQLELERTQHLSALNTGLLVERTHVTAELTRLMEKATEEAAQRGQAESARQDIEKDLDDLSASLFGQANSMVAEARFAQHLSEQKVANAERALKGAEEAVSVMQQQMQALQAEKEEAERKAQEALIVMGKGKYVERRESITRPIRLRNSHVPYQDFLLFVAHLRSLHSSSSHPPTITTLLPLPFLARVSTEDSEPTLRLDLAPSLNWLSRRTVLSAIHNGQLIIEPISSATLLQESGTPGTHNGSNSISCALCGTPIFAPETSTSRPQPPLLSQLNTNSLSWSTSLFKKPSNSTAYSISANNSQPSTPPAHSVNRSFQQLAPPQVYIFRLAPQASNNAPATSIPSKIGSSGGSTSISQCTDQNSHTPNNTSTTQSSTIYPLCTNNWCLMRLRTTCTLWAFMRTGIVEKLWEEQVPTLLPPTIITSPIGEKPPVPPRRRGLWGMASALGGRASSWSEGDKEKTKKSASVVSKPDKPAEPRRLPPPPPPAQPDMTAANAPVPRTLPPPLPKRNEVRTSPPALPDTESTNTHAQETIPTLPPRPPRRPVTPASVPLPESRPHTPPVPSSVSIPIVVGSVPPPLPRRAAARASRAFTEIPPNPIHTGEVEAIAESKAEHEDSAAVAVHSVGESEVRAPIPTEEVQGSTLRDKEPVDSGAMEVVGTEAQKLSPRNSEEARPEPEVVSPTEPLLLKEHEGSDEETTQTSAANDDEGKDEAVEQGNSVDNTERALLTEKGAVKSDEEAKDETPRVSSDEEGTSDTSDFKSSESHEKKVDDDKGLYIGDATWEERTWKEVVRLREEMFWARIGGSR